ncbi:MAG: hypothetical protein WD024_06830 [Bacillota bacterium]
MAKGADEVIDHLRGWGDRRRAAIVALAKNYAGTLEARAKQNASWTDRTGNARNGLFGAVQVSGIKADTVVIRLAHSMDYGPFLELANDGKYAILKPTLDAAVPEIYKAYERLWKDEGG